MRSYLFKTTWQTIVTVVLASFLLFVAISFLPGDPLRGLFGFRRPDPDVLADLHAQFHMDEPLLKQYFLYMTDLFRGDLGRSLPEDLAGTITSGPPISSILGSAIPTSLVIVGGALVVQVILAPIIALVGGMKPHSRLDRNVHAWATLAVAFPVIVSTYLLQAVFGRWIPILPPTWMFDQTWQNYVIPIVALGVSLAAYAGLVARSEMQDVLKRSYIKMARASGIPPWRVVAIHAVRPSIGPVLRLTAANISALITGLLIVEITYQAPGFGNMIYNAIKTQDRSLLLTSLLIVLILVILVNRSADIIHATIDPRVRLEG
ncbi:MAG: ABC transporter permease subunit [Acidimicrobiia bacterium]|nr:ABC transporter permease subunit [Acidimicrobiia bacterium]